jgi:hypothetical protein
VVSFNISQFLGAISKQHDVKVLFYRIYHICDEVFELQIQNYIFFLNVNFDTRIQKHIVTAIHKNRYSMELMMVRLSRTSKPETFELLLGDSDLIIKTDSRIVLCGRYLNEVVASRP